MTQVGIRELKAKLSEYIRKAKDGETIDITEHGKTVARLGTVVHLNTETGWSVRETAPSYQATGSATLEKSPNKKAAVSAPKSYTALLKTAQKAGGHKSPKETLTEALSEYVHRQRRLRIAEAFGQIEYDPDYDYKKQRRRG
jgi:prevent-host-death family protein